MLSAEQLPERKIGIFDNISNAEYHAPPKPDEDPSYSSSIVKMMEIPALARYEMDAPQEYKECYRMGSAIHKFVLERADFESEFLTGIDCARRSKADKEEWAAWFYEHGADGDHITSHKAAEWNGLFEQLSGKSMVTPEEITKISMMAESVMRNPMAAKLLTGGKAEQSIYWQDEETGLYLRCRPDYLGRFCSDLKSTQDAREAEFLRSAYRMGYHVSAAMYTDGIQQVTGEHHPFLFIAIEKTPPFLCAVYGLDDYSAERGWSIYQEFKLRLAECLVTGKWEGLPNNLRATLPKYAF